jgi:hypothetical protein
MARWSTRELDQTTADAVALMTLYIGATEGDDACADDLLEVLFAAPDGPGRTLGGFQSLCGALLVLLELETGTTPGSVLRRVGSMVSGDGCLSS